jgi:hypothetical protein
MAGTRNPAGVLVSFVFFHRASVLPVAVLEDALRTLMEISLIKKVSFKSFSKGNNGRRY